MRKRRSPLHNHNHASNIKKRPYDNTPPPTTPSALTQARAHIICPCGCITGALQITPTPCSAYFYLPHLGLCSTIQGLLHASLLLQQWKPTYPRNILRHSSPALLKPSLSSPPVISHAFLSTPYSPCSPSSPPVALIPAAGFPA